MNNRNSGDRLGMQSRANVGRWMALSLAVAAANTAMGATVHTWTGNGANALWSDPANWQGNVAPAANSEVELVFPAGAPKKSSLVNVGGLTIKKLTVNDPGTVFSPAFIVSSINLSGEIRLETAELTFASTLQVQLTGPSTVKLKSQLVGMNTYSKSRLNFNSKISGAGSLVVEGDATAPKGSAGNVYFAASQANTYAGTTTFKNGVRAVLGNFQWVFYNTGTTMYWAAEGLESVPHDLNIQSGADVELSYDDQIGDTGDIAVEESSRLDMARAKDTVSGLTCAGRFESELYSTTTYGQLTVNGPVTIVSHAEGSWGAFTSDQLVISVNAGYVPPNNAVFTIINHQGWFDHVIEPFHGWAEGDTLTIGGKLFDLSYVGGQGQDLTLQLH